MDLLLGLDVGTTATKVLLFDLQGHVVAFAVHPYSLITPREGWVEQDPEEFWRGVVQAIRAVTRQLGPGDHVIALSQSSQGGTTIPVARDGTPTHNALSWMDQRARDQARRVRQTWGADRLYTNTGWALQNGLPLQHIAWFRENCPDAFARTHRFLFVNDWVMGRLTDQRCMNPSDASITQLFSVATADWDERLLETAGITRDHVSPVLPSGSPVGTLTAEASEATGLSPDTLVVNGAHDQYCAAIGTGVLEPGPVLLSCGTAWVLLAVPESLELGLGSGLAISCHAARGRWGAIHSMGGVGASLEWFLDRIWSTGETKDEREATYRAVNAGVIRSPAGANGLICCPLTGGHAAAASRKAGGFLGLSLHHSRDDMARSVMEGIALELRWVIQDLRERGIRADELKMVGGAAESPIWPQIVADITGIPVTLPTLKQAASRGAAILAGVGAGLFPTFEAGLAAFQGEESRLEPDAQHRAVYDTLFERYRKAETALATVLGPSF